MPDSCHSKKGDLQGLHAGCHDETGKTSHDCGMSDSFPEFRFRFTPSGFLLILIRFYKKVISPLLPPCCRFTPTCSVYAAQAILIHGFWKGSRLAFLRILRCNPFCAGGYDPVPPKHNKKVES